MMLAIRVRGEGVIHHVVWPVSYLLAQFPATAHIRDGWNPTAPLDSRVTLESWIKEMQYLKTIKDACGRSRAQQCVRV